jgi:hypothetical protein
VRGVALWRNGAGVRSVGGAGGENGVAFALCRDAGYGILQEGVNYTADTGGGYVYISYLRNEIDTGGGYLVRAKA